jgi:hypothetical protein
MANILTESFCWVIFALAPISFVWIRLFFIQAILLDVIKSIILITTTTALATSWGATINKLLFWEAVQGSILYFAAALSACYGWKSPTSTTLPLIFYWINSTFSSPINWCWKRSTLIIGSYWIVLVSVWRFVTKDFLELWGCPIGKIINANCESILSL